MNFPPKQVFITFFIPQPPHFWKALRAAVILFRQNVKPEKKMKHYLDLYKEVTIRKWNYLALSDYQGADYTYAQVASEISRLHHIFRKAGLSAGDRVALCGNNSAHWAMAFLATGSYRAVGVPLLYDFTDEAKTKLLAHSGVRLVFTDRKTFDGLDITALPDLRCAVNLEDFSCLWARSEEYGFDFSSQTFSPDLNFTPGSLDDLAVINYTSGTTGDPKGVMLSNRSLSSNVEYGHANIPVFDTDCSLSMLPLAHMFGLVFELLYVFCGGGHIYFLGKTPNPSTLLKALSEVRPYQFLTVPLVIEKIVKGKVLPTLEKPHMKVLTRIPIVKGLIYRKIRHSLMDALGGKVRNLIFGGAALNPKVEDVLHKAKMPYMVGYGMTECGPLVAYADWKVFKRGSCGRELGSAAHIRIDSADEYREIGEVQVKGDNVMMGYYRNEEATRAAFTSDGWLRTGDLGVKGRDGSIYLRGRSKCMILSSSGQNIYPEEIEAVINSLPEVEESLVVSRSGKLVGLVTLVKGIDHSVIHNCLEKINKLLPSYSKLSSFEVLKEPFVHTPKRSIKRNLYM